MVKQQEQTINKSAIWWANLRKNLDRRYLCDIGETLVRIDQNLSQQTLDRLWSLLEISENARLQENKNRRAQAHLQRKLSSVCRRATAVLRENDLLPKELPLPATKEDYARSLLDIIKHKIPNGVECEIKICDSIVNLTETSVDEISQIIMNAYVDKTVEIPDTERTYEWHLKGVTTSVATLSMCINDNLDATFAEIVARYASIRSIPFVIVAKALLNLRNTTGMYRYQDTVPVRWEPRDANKPIMRA